MAAGTLESLAAMAEASLNLGSPRIRAAMRVLGILPKEVDKLDPDMFEGRQDLLKLKEQKRQNIIDEVKKKAHEASDGAPGKFGVDASGLTREERNALFMEEVARNERENMVRMQKLAKKDVQKVVITELEAKHNAHKAKKKQQESAQRMKEMLKARDDELATRKKVADKKQEKNQEVRARALKTLAEHGEEMTESLRKANERAEKKIVEIAEGREEQKVKNAEKRVQIFQRQEGYERDQLRRRETAYGEHCEKMQNKLDMLEHALAERQSNLEEIAEKQRQCSENVKVFQLEKQANAEKKYWEICARHDTAAKTRDENLKTLLKEYQTKNSKRKSAHESRYDRLLNEFEKDPGMKVCASDAPGSPKFTPQRSELRKSLREKELARREKEGIVDGMTRSFSDSKLLATFEHRKSHVQLAEDNRQRLRRAHHYAVEAQLDKLLQMRKKVEIMQGSKQEADRRRTAVTAKCSLEKMHMTERVDRVKNSADPDKMFSMLEELDPDQEAVGRINELLGGLGLAKFGRFTEEEEGK